jgi:phosphate:Na+ symporter
VVNTIIFIGFTGWFARVAIRIAPTPKENKTLLIEPKFLNYDIIHTPTLAMGQVRLELARMAELNSEMFSNIRLVTMTKDSKQLKEIFQKYDKINILESAVLNYLSKIRREELTEQESNDHQLMMTISINLQNQATIIRQDITEILQYFISHNYKPSDITREIFLNFYHDICTTLEDNVTVIENKDQQIAETVINQQQTIKNYEEAILSRKSSHFGSDQENYIKTARLEISLMEKMVRIHSLARAISKQILYPKNNI